MWPCLSSVRTLKLSVALLACGTTPDDLSFAFLATFQLPRPHMIDDAYGFIHTH